MPGIHSMYHYFYLPSVGEPNSTGKAIYDAALEATDIKLTQLINQTSGADPLFWHHMRHMVMVVGTLVVNNERYFSTEKINGGDTLI